VKSGLLNFKEKNPDFKYTILRPTGIFGPEETATKYQLIASINFGLFFFSPKNTGKTQWTYIDDVVDAIVAAMKQEKKNQIYIISSDDWMTYEEVICTLCGYLNRIEPLFSLPVPLIASIVKYTKFILNIPFQTPFLFEEKTVMQMKSNRWYNNAKAKRELNWRPRYTMREGYKKTVKWYFDHGKIRKWKISPVGIITILLVLGFLLLFWVF